MSGTASKRVRRDLRRAVGEEAVSIVDQHTAMLNAHQQLHQRHEQLLKANVEARDLLKSRIVALEARTWPARWARVVAAARVYLHRLRTH